jgi:uncharacterized protein (TIGR00297 family)
VFFLAWIATRFGRVRKQSFGLAERGEGRQASQVLANLGVAALCGIGYFALANFAWLLALVAALAEAAADTVSSEIGQAIGAEPRLVTTWRRVPPGTDGGVTVQGSLAGIAAAAIVVLVSVLTGMIPWRCFGIAVVAAIVGMLGDSFLGAWLERRGLLNNDGVNFLGTMIAAMVGWFFVH